MIAAPPLPEIAQLYPLRRPAAPRASRRALDVDDIDRRRRLQQLGGVGRAHALGQAAARQRSAPAAGGAVDLVSGAPGAASRRGASPVNVVGATLAGVPLIVLGRSDTLAWGFTNTGPDVQDLFIEKINPDNPREYLTPEGWRRSRSTQMTIAVKGAGVRKVERRRTRHGPVLPGFYRNLEALLATGPRRGPAVDRARATTTPPLPPACSTTGVRGVGDYMERMRQYIVPMQSMVVADTTGKIGLIAPGRVPVRDPANKMAGRAPVPGWDATYDWKGYLTFEDLPRVVDPPAGAIGTANARIVGPDYPHFLTYDWDRRVPPAARQGADPRPRRPRHREHARRAGRRVLAARRRACRSLMIVAAQAGGGVDDCRARPAHRLGRRDARRGARAADLHGLGARGGARDLRDDLGAAFPRYFDTRALALTRLLEGRAKCRDWCDDRTTPARESCGDVLAAALATALKDLERRYGTDRSKWWWGTAHYAFSEHRPFGAFAGIGRYLQRRGAEPRRRLHAQPRQGGVRRGAAVRQPARLELPRHLRPRRPRPLALHPHHRAVRQPVLALLPLVRGALVQGRVHRDPRPSGPRSTRPPSAPGSSRPQ